MATAPVFMLRTVTNAGALDKYLPDFGSIDMSPVYCDAGVLKFTYPARGVNSNLLVEDMDIAVLVNGVEIGDLRAVVETIEKNDAPENEEEFWTYTCRTMASQLDYAMVYPDNWIPLLDTLISKPKLPNYVEKTPGYILNNLFSKAQARGALAGFTWDFNASTDSEGSAWLDNVSIAPEVGTTYLSVMKSMVEGGIIEFNVVGRKVRVWSRAGMGIDRTIGGTPLVFRKARDITEAPRKIDSKGLVSTLLIGSSTNEVFAEVQSAGSISTFGRREGFKSWGEFPYKARVSGQSLMEFMGAKWLNDMDSPMVELTHGLHFETEDNPRPVTHFNVGDWAFSDTGNGLERFRIMQWVMSVDGEGNVTGSISMGRLFNTQLSQVNDAINAVTNGSTNTGSAPKNDKVAPEKVTGVIPTSGNYLVNDIARATLNVTWSAVDENADGSDIFDLDCYQVAWKYTSDTVWRAPQRVENDVTQALYQNLDPSRGVQVRVKAMDVWGNSGAWSDIAAITTAGDTIAPLKPASPVVTSKAGTLNIVWSGLDSLGGAQPADLAGVEVHVSTADFTPSAGTLKDVLPPKVLTTTLTGLTYGTEYWVKLIAFDTTGNKSPASDTTTTSHAVLQQVVQTDIGGNVIDFSNIRFKDVGNFVPDGSFELATTAAIVAALGNQLSVVTNPNGATAAPSPKVLRVTTGAAYTWQVTKNINASSDQTFAFIYSFRQENFSGADSCILQISCVRQDGTMTWVTAKAFSSTTNTGTTWTQRQAAVVTVPANTVQINVELFANISSATGVLYLDQWEVRQQLGTVLIQDLAVNNAKIALLAVNDANIANVSAGKLTVGSLTADITVSARIKTANTGARAELNSGGFGLWDSTNLQTVSFAGANGSVKIIGNLVSGPAGRRIDINPFGTSLPEIRFYPTTGSNYGFLNAVGDGSQVSVGLNSGSFTANGQTSQYRLWMTDASSGLNLETVRSDTQAQWGGYLGIYPDLVTAAVKTGAGERAGFVDVWGAVAGAPVDDPMMMAGHNSSTSSLDGWFQVTNQGRLDFIGRVWNTGVTAPFNSNAVMFGNGQDVGDFSSWSWSWGTTMLTTPAVIATLRDDVVRYNSITANTTTGWTATWGGGTTNATHNVYWVAWRH